MTRRGEVAKKRAEQWMMTHTFDGMIALVYDQFRLI